MERFPKNEKEKLTVEDLPSTEEIEKHQEKRSEIKKAMEQAHEQGNKELYQKLEDKLEEIKIGDVETRSRARSVEDIRLDLEKITEEISLRQKEDRDELYTKRKNLISELEEAKDK